MSDFCKPSAVAVWLAVWESLLRAVRYGPAFAQAARGPGKAAQLRTGALHTRHLLVSHTTQTWTAWGVLKHKIPYSEGISTGGAPASIVLTLRPTDHHKLPKYRANSTFGHSRAAEEDNCQRGKFTDRSAAVVRQQAMHC